MDKEKAEKESAAVDQDTKETRRGQRCGEGETNLP
jgi:hypothetical protein